MDRKNAQELKEHIFGSYFSLRIGLAAIGVALPLVVLASGAALHHVWLEPSISRYYHTAARLPYLTTRDLFVGGLFAVAACLYLYKGFGSRENIALNMAGVFAVLVALLPTAAKDGDPGLVPTLHKTSAVLFFLCIAYVSLFRARDTIPLLPVDKQDGYRRKYLWTGAAMVVLPLLAVVLSYVFAPGSKVKALTFLVESFAVWAFAWYWLVKTKEMRETSAERRALDAKLRREVVVAPAPGTEASASPAPEAERPRLKKMLRPQQEAIVPAE